jgi:hypothetical protein
LSYFEEWLSCNCCCLLLLWQVLVSPPLEQLVTSLQVLLLRTGILFLKAGQLLRHFALQRSPAKSGSFAARSDQGTVAMLAWCCTAAVTSISMMLLRTDAMVLQLKARKRLGNWR